MTSRRLLAVTMTVLLAVGAIAVSIFAQEDQAPEGDPVISATDLAILVDEDEQDDEDEVAMEQKQLAAAEMLGPSLVVVEYTLRFDKGEAPRFYGSSAGGRYGSRLIEQERPLEVSGFLLAPTIVLTPDLIIHPRFVESIAVRAGDHRVSAHPQAYALNQSGMLLEMDEALPDTTPLQFDPAGEEPYLGAIFQQVEGQWTVQVSGTTSIVALTETGRTFSPSSTNVILLTEEGAPVGISMSDETPVGDSWKGSPLDWPMISADEMADELARIEETADAALVRVALNFRSLPKRPGMQSDYDDPDEAGTERNVVGVLIGDNRVLVMENMRQHITRRLERIDVYPADGDPVRAEFVGTLTDFGALVAELQSPLPGGVTLVEDDIRDYRGRLLMLADVTVKGDNRLAYYARDRIIGYQLGWERMLYPVLPGNEEGLFLFDSDGRLIVLPIARRLKTTIVGSYSASPVATAAADLAYVQGDDLADVFDPNNIPLSEAEENRLAWLGVALQPLDRDLARMYQVSEMTNDGQTGAIVSYVYPGSPAEEAGVQPRWILLRLNVEGQPRPLEVQTREWYFEINEFPWEDYNQLPEMYYDEIPTPWPPVDGNFTRALTDLGFGASYEAEFFVDGEVVTRQFQVVESPAHYESAPRYEHEALGLTVRDITYELRRYFRMDENDEGVIISKIEPGSLASVAGLKPYEVIAAINDEPVDNVEDFEELVAGQIELRLHVQRMTRGRNVKVSLPATPSRPPEEPVDVLPVEPDPLPAIPETVE